MNFWLVSLFASFAVSTTAFAEIEKKVVIYNLTDTPYSFEKFEALSGIYVEVDKGDSIEEMKKDPFNSPHPDLVIQADAIDFATMKNQGLLQPFSSPAIEGNIAPQFRDLSSGWVGMAFRARVLAYNPKVITPPTSIRYEDLDKPEFKNKLCLRRSDYSYTRALISSLILADGYDSALNLIKGWVSNTHEPIFQGDLYALQALDAGTCGLAFVNSDYFSKYRSRSLSKLKMLWPNQNDRGAHVGTAGLGLLKESKNPDLAIQLIEFTAQDEQAHLDFSAIKQSFPTNLKFFSKSDSGKHAGAIKWDQTPLSKIVELDEKAQSLVKEAGYGN